MSRRSLIGLIVSAPQQFTSDRFHGRARVAAMLEMTKHAKGVVAMPVTQRVVCRVVEAASQPVALKKHYARLAVVICARPQHSIATTRVTVLFQFSIDSMMRIVFSD